MEEPSDNILHNKIKQIKSVEISDVEEDNSKDGTLNVSYNS